MHSVQASEIAPLIKRLKKATEVDPDIDGDIHLVVNASPTHFKARSLS